MQVEEIAGHTIHVNAWLDEQISRDSKPLFLIGFQPNGSPLITGAQVDPVTVIAILEKITLGLKSQAYRYQKKDVPHG